MANLPVQSMTTGGMYWFTDLTVPDPFYALPLITASTFLCIVEVCVYTISYYNDAVTIILLTILPIQFCT